MRLFIAVNFDDKVKERLSDTQARLREYAVKGRFTGAENLHLTLIFIGELEDASAVIKSMDGVNSGKFKLKLNGVGSFKRESGDIWWAGIGECAELTKLRSNLSAQLYKNGVKFDSKGFSPHITLAREVVLDKRFNMDLFTIDTPAIETEVCKISLMKSERPGGKLTYTEIYAKYLTHNFS